MSKASNLAHHEKISKLIIDAIESGVGDFQLPWYGGSRPKNVVSGNSYKGTNSGVLMASGLGRSSEWGTFLQWKDKGGKLRKGSKGVPIFVYKPLPSKDTKGDDKEKSKRFYYGESYVFNRDDVDDLPATELPGPTEIPDKIEHVNDFVKRTGAVVNVRGDAAFYSQTTDEITMPNLWLFKKGNATEAFYQVLLHELTHWSGSKERLDRFGTDSSWAFGGTNYAKEELVAELASSFLCADLSISMFPRPDHAQYINSWLSELRQDPMAFSQACVQAEAAVTYLMQITNWDTKSQTEPEQHTV